MITFETLQERKATLNNVYEQNNFINRISNLGHKLLRK